MLESYYMEESMLNTIDDITEFEVFQGESKKSIKSGEEGFSNIKNRLGEIYKISTLAPAFGVSLHTETQKALKEGTWLKINYGKEKEVNELPFTSLLIKLEEEPLYGFNIIREQNLKYEGRCIYIHLEHELCLKDILG